MIKKINQIHRHVPSLLKNLRKKADRLKNRIKHYENLQIHHERQQDYCEIEITEQKQKILSINFDIEQIEDPYSRPLGTGQENPRTEKLIRELEADVKHLEGEIHTLQSECARHEILIRDCQIHIDKHLDQYLSLDNRIHSLEIDQIVNRAAGKGDYLEKEPALDVEYEVQIQNETLPKQIQKQSKDVKALYRELNIELEKKTEDDENFKT